ncbi:MAG: right-handed parallel beta-helix repeat-containing protein [Verrucomicrobia bacterium]|nr:right-handed parallel beta-helix repeat-containing protein [Verrucomicrobiota bacterium]
MRFYFRSTFASLSVFTFLTLGFVSELDAATYYVSPNGNDSNNGLSTSAPWRTISKVNGVNFAAGDRILFQGDATFAGTISLDANDRGTSSNPIIVSSYGTGRATINAGNETGFLAFNTAGITLSNLKFVGAGASVNTKDGVNFYTGLSGNVKLDGITIDNVEVSGFGKCGVSVGSWNNQTGYRDVRITNVFAHDNLHAGIATYAQVPNVHSNVYVGSCVAYNNFGNPKSSGNTGSGIVLGNVINATIERCVAYSNGKNNFAPTEGPVGIWAYDSSYVTIQYNEAYSNRTGSGKDGGGFDLDINVSNSIMQYNYSYDNDGAGYLLCCGNDNRDNVIRYNISANDGRKNGYAGIHTYGNITGAEIYNNTVYLTQTNGSPRAVLLVTGTTNLRFLNNIFYGVGGARLLEASSGQSGLVFLGNNYFATNGSFSIRFNNVNYSTLDSWRNASGQETVSGVAIGSGMDPKLVAPGTGGILNNAYGLTNVTAYKLQKDSPMIDRGVNLNTYYSTTGLTDFYGAPLMQGAGFDVGVHEWTPDFVQVSRLDAPLFKDGVFSFEAIGPIGATNAVQFSTDLVSWATLTNIVNTTGTITFEDIPVKGTTRKYFRSKQL